jgi:hypothetical protein
LAILFRKTPVPGLKKPVFWFLKEEAPSFSILSTALKIPVIRKGPHYLIR